MGMALQFTHLHGQVAWSLSWPPVSTEGSLSLFWLAQSPSEKQFLLTMIIMIIIDFVYWRLSWHFTTYKISSITSVIIRNINNNVAPVINQYIQDKHDATEHSLVMSY